MTQVFSLTMSMWWRPMVRVRRSATRLRSATSTCVRPAGPGRPLMIGSVKTNLGHLELAAGMAGLLKLVVGMQHERFPGQVGFETPNPSLDLTWPVHIASAAMPWRSVDGRRRIGGVSAFGLSGTNAHALLASRAPVASEPSPRAAHPLLLSSRTAEGLVAQARQLKAARNERGLAARGCGLHPRVDVLHCRTGQQVWRQRGRTCWHGSTQWSQGLTRWKVGRGHHHKCRHATRGLVVYGPRKPVSGYGARTLRPVPRVCGCGRCLRPASAGTSRFRLVGRALR